MEFSSGDSHNFWQSYLFLGIMREGVAQGVCELSTRARHCYRLLACLGRLFTCGEATIPINCKWKKNTKNSNMAVHREWGGQTRGIKSADLWQRQGGRGKKTRTFFGRHLWKAPCIVSLPTWHYVACASADFPRWNSFQKSFSGELRKILLLRRRRREVLSFELFLESLVDRPVSKWCWRCHSWDASC